jgi:methylmalonic aciduria homocystinuria type C protein
MSSSDTIAHVTERCRAGGLDLVHAYATDAGRLGLLIANSRALWPVALAHLDPQADRPLDTYVVKVVEAATEGIDCVIRYAHVPPFVPIQRLAHDVGFAYLAATNLSIHPEYGPWVGLRAVIECNQACALERTPATDPCARCACAGPLAEAAAHPDDWEKRLAVRDACCVGRAHRYSDAQIRYHYTKDRRFLTHTEVNP